MLIQYAVHTLCHTAPAQMRLSAASPAACAEELMPVVSATALHARCPSEKNIHPTKEQQKRAFV